MRHNDSVDSAKQKAIARQRYRERKMDQFVKWSIATKGYVRLKDIERVYNQYNNKNNDSYERK
jgi:hypothetical protein